MQQHNRTLELHKILDMLAAHTSNAMAREMALSLDRKNSIKQKKHFLLPFNSVHRRFMPFRICGAHCAVPSPAVPFPSGS